MFYSDAKSHAIGERGDLLGGPMVAGLRQAGCGSSPLLQPYMRSNPGCIQEEGMFTGPFGDGDDDD